MPKIRSILPIGLKKLSEGLYGPKSSTHSRSIPMTQTEITESVRSMERRMEIEENERQIEDNVNDWVTFFTEISAINENYNFWLRVFTQPVRKSFEIAILQNKFMELSERTTQLMYDNKNDKDYKIKFLLSLKKKVDYDAITIILIGIKDISSGRSNGIDLPEYYDDYRYFRELTRYMTHLIDKRQETPDETIPKGGKRIKRRNKSRRNKSRRHR
jgi:hypothetical protein